MPSPVQRPAAAASAGDSRRRLVASRALRLFARLGFDKVSLQDISKATGVPRTALYRYFHSKREIFDAAISGVLAELRESINKAIERPVSVPERLLEVCDIVVDGLFAHREFLLAIFNFAFAMVKAGEDMSSRVVGFTGGLVRAFGRLMTEGVADGSLGRAVDPALGAELFFSLMKSEAFNILLEMERDSSAAKRRFRAAVAALAAERPENLV